MHVTHTTANVLISCVRWQFHILFTVYVNVIMMELPFVIGGVYSYKGDEDGPAGSAKAGPLFGQVLTFSLFSFQLLTVNFVNQY